MVQSLSLCLLNNQKYLIRTVLVEEMRRKSKGHLRSSIVRAVKAGGQFCNTPLYVIKWY